MTAAQEERVDRVMEIGQREAEETMRALAKVEGIFAGGPRWQHTDALLKRMSPTCSLILDLL